MFHPLAFATQQTDHLDNLRTACRCGEKLDSLGNVVALLPSDNLRNLVQENAYDPWGLNLPDLERSAVLPDWWQFSTKERDYRAYNEFEFRHYDAAIGRFMSIDPLFQEFRGITPFNYADNNPSTFIDLYGLQGIDPIFLREVVVIGKRSTPIFRNLISGYGAGVGGALINSYLANRVSADISSLRRNLQQPGRVTVSDGRSNLLTSTNSSETGIRRSSEGGYEQFPITRAEGEFVDPALVALDFVLQTNFSGINNGDPNIRGGSGPGAAFGRVASLGNRSGLSLRQSYSELVKETTQKYGGNVTVQRDGIDLFRIHQTSSGHGFNITQFRNRINPASGEIFKNPIEVNLRRTHLKQLEKAIKGDPRYNIRTRGKR